MFIRYLNQQQIKLHSLCLEQSLIFQGNSFIFSRIQGTYFTTLVNTSGYDVLHVNTPSILILLPNEFIPTTVTFPSTSMTAPPNFHKNFVKSNGANQLPSSCLEFFQ